MPSRGLGDVYKRQKLHWPGFIDYDWLFFLNYGMVKPAFIVAFVYGWAFQAGLGVAIWLTARLCRAEIRNPLTLIVAGHFWNIGVVLGILCIFLGAATGMAAINSVYMTLLGAGKHVVATDAMYGPSRTILETEFARFGVEADFVDSSDADNVARAMRSDTALVYIETPANPTLKLSDISACAEIAHAHGAVLAADNTFASPYLQNPIAHGADIVVHSMTKYINGHSDVVAGMIVAADEEMLERLRKVHVNLGGTMDPHQAWLVLRGIKTLGLRVEKAQANAMQLARYLEAHPAVDWVRYPGLASHPQHELAVRQMRGAGGIVSFGVVGGVEGGRRLIDAAELMVRAVSLGGIETLIEHPASMTHKGVPADERLEAGITDDLVRVAVGCEDAEDLLADLEQALEKAAAGVTVGA